MTPDHLHWPVVYSQGTLIRYTPVTTDEVGACCGAYFGGPLQQSFSGVEFGPEPLHRLFTFCPLSVPQPEGHRVTGRMSLFYGMRFDGCLLIRSHQNTESIDASLPLEVTSMSKVKSSPDWPYAGYPQILPYIPLMELSRESMTPSQFEKTCTWQGLEDWVGGYAPWSGQELVIIIPPIARLGVSMWGFDGDEMGTQIIGCYNFETQEMRVSNQCA
jgi:hypothetical protein